MRRSASPPRGRGAAGDGEATLRLRSFARGCTGPVALCARAGDGGALYVAEQAGKVYRFARDEEKGVLDAPRGRSHGVRAGGLPGEGEVSELVW